MSIDTLTRHRAIAPWLAFIAAILIIVGAGTWALRPAGTVPVWSYEAGAVRPIGDRTCHPTGTATDGIPLWTCDWAAQAPPAGWQCVETVERVILCSAHYSASGLTTVSVKR